MFQEMFDREQLDPDLLRQFEQDGTTCQWHVYALKDPRDGAVRYVGITFNPDQRLNGHLAEQSDSRKSAWIATLRKRGLAPEMAIVESGDGGWSAQAGCEQRWIAHFRPTGKLFNLTSGGETGRGRGAERVTYSAECSARRRAGRKPKRAYGELPGEAEVVQRIRELWAREYGYLTIVKDLNEAGIKTRLKGRWYIPIVKRVLVELGLEFPPAVHKGSLVYKSLDFI
jgi:hypothetical protein